MKNIKKYDVKACCGKKSVVIETDFPFFKAHNNTFSLKNYKTQENYIKSGMIYIENDYLIGIIGIGSNKIKISCKKDCEEGIQFLIKDLEHF
jgi:hypothetical protein